jgi:hypothetical protein
MCRELKDDSNARADDCGGFADRLSAIEQLLMVSMLHKFVFLMQWEVAQDVFYSPYFNWTYDESIVVYEGRDTQHPRIAFMGCVSDGDKQCPMAHKDTASLFPYDVNFVLLNRGGIRFASEENMLAFYETTKLSPVTAPGCLFRSLVQPRKIVVDKFMPYAVRLLDSKMHSIVLHIRNGDKPMHLETKMNYTFTDQYWSCVMSHVKQRLDGNKTAPLVLFITDSKSYKLSAKEYFTRLGLSSTFLATDVKPYHINKQQLGWDGLLDKLKAGEITLPSPVERLVDTVGEWWLMSLGNVLIMGGSSGFSRTAFAYSSVNTVGINIENFEGKAIFGCFRPVLVQEVTYLGSGF